MSADPFLAHVRFVDHTERCPECNDTLWPAICPRGRELLVSWQEAENLATKQAEEADRAAHIEACADATGEPYTEDCAQELGANYREDRMESEVDQ